MSNLVNGQSTEVNKLSNPSQHPWSPPTPSQTLPAFSAFSPKDVTNGNTSYSSKTSHSNMSYSQTSPGSASSVGKSSPGSYGLISPTSAAFASKTSPGYTSYSKSSPGYTSYSKTSPGYTSYAKPNVHSVSKSNHYGAVSVDTGYFSNTLAHNDMSSTVEAGYNNVEGKEATSDQAVECDICHLILASPFSLKRHKLSHTGTKPFVCSVCNWGFLEAGRLRKHMEKFHPEQAAQELAIQQQKLLSSSKNKITASADLQRAIDSGTMPVCRCTLCGNSFTNTSDLSKHMSIHTRHKVFACHMCKKPYQTPTELQAHILTCTMAGVPCS